MVSSTPRAHLALRTAAHLAPDSAVAIAADLAPHRVREALAESVPVAGTGSGGEALQVALRVASVCAYVISHGQGAAHFPPSLCSPPCFTNLTLSCPSHSFKLGQRVPQGIDQRGWGNIEGLAPTGYQKWVCGGWLSKNMPRSLES